MKKKKPADEKPRTTLPQPFEIHQNAREEWTILFGTSLRTEDEWGGTMVADIYAVDCSFRTIYSRPTFESGRGGGMNWSEDDHLTTGDALLSWSAERRDIGWWVFHSYCAV
ncbi:hypothetical protein TNCT_10541 [Trichonephila clavata]|uniref:Uncharacterized protein n=1 Tax=Trichonephila clavata TaxID=2740835 RepID=A0A8X6LTP1_TRICU|nr:hypothetical protein TNCT_10541 [Trichonephila clavata]